MKWAPASSRAPGSWVAAAALLASLVGSGCSKSGGRGHYAEGAKIALRRDGEFDLERGEGWVVTFYEMRGGRLGLPGLETSAAFELPRRPEARRPVDLATARVAYRDGERKAAFASSAASGTLELLEPAGGKPRARVRATFTSPTSGAGERRLSAEFDLEPYPLRPRP